MSKHTEPADSAAPVTRTFALSDVVDQYRELVAEAEQEPGFIHDTLIIGGGVAGAGVLRDLASRGNASAILVDRGPFGAQTSSKTGKAIHPGIRYLRMAFHRLLLAFRLRRDPKIKQSFLQNLRGAWLDLQLVWYGTRERKILMETTRNTVEEIPNVVLVLPDSPERKWAVFFGISLYDLFTTLWAWCGLVPRFSRVKLYRTGKAVHRDLPNLAAARVLGGIRYWDGKANNDKVLVVKAIRDAYYRGSKQYPIRALSHVEVAHYQWRQDGRTGYFEVTLARRFEHETLPEQVVVRAYTITNAAGPWVDQARNRTPQQDGRTSVVYSRGSHLEATNRFIHQTLSADPRTRVGLVPLNEERQHYLRPFQQNGIWYIQCTTTDRAHQDPDLVVPMADEIEELLQCYNELVDKRWQIDRRDIFQVFCGIRPLASGDGGQIAVSDISRMFRINKRRAGGGTVYDLVNVKLTEFRWAGRAVGDQLAKELRRKRGTPLQSSTTHQLPFLPVAEEEQFALNRPDHPSGDREFLRAKVTHYVRYQMVSSYEDYLLNTGGIRDAVVFDEDGRCELDLEVLDLVLTELAALLGWDRQRCLHEWAAFQEVYTRNMAHAELGERVRDRVPALADHQAPDQQPLDQQPPDQQADTGDPDDADAAGIKDTGSAVAAR
jgi:glycerol-3-phosphate dehydrogenase